MANRIFDDYQGPSVKVNGVCYKFIGETTSSVNSYPTQIQGTFDSCLECALESSSSESTVSSSSESFDNVSTSSESINNNSSSSSYICENAEVNQVVPAFNQITITPPTLWSSQFPTGKVCVDETHEGNYENHGAVDLITFDNEGAASTFSSGQSIQVCEGPCPPVSSSSSSEGYSESSSSSYVPPDLTGRSIYVGNGNSLTQLDPVVGDLLEDPATQGNQIVWGGWFQGLQGSSGAYWFWIENEWRLGKDVAGNSQSYVRLNGEWQWSRPASGPARGGWQHLMWSWTPYSNEDGGIAQYASYWNGLAWTPYRTFNGTFSFTNPGGGTIFYDTEPNFGIRATGVGVWSFPYESQMTRAQIASWCTSMKNDYTTINYYNMNEATYKKSNIIHFWNFNEPSDGSSPVTRYDVVGEKHWTDNDNGSGYVTSATVIPTEVPS